MTFSKLDEFFQAAFRETITPFDYQRRLAEDPGCKSRLINVPTGCGKTAAVVLAWLWNRVAHPHEKHRAIWPRRLVYCLPMRTLVEQTGDNVRKWLRNLDNLEWDGEGDHRGKIGVHILMGGEEKTNWDLYPEHDAIVIGTQDMLLSRALNRGYGMSRYRWPMHFGLLNNDCLWVMDETQLMGVGVETSAQLDGFRHAEKTGARPGCRTWWMSATLDDAQLATVDHPRPNDGWPSIKLENEDLALPAVRERFNAKKKIAPAPLILDATTKDDSKPLAKFIAEQHQGVPDELMLVIVNRVPRAQKIYERLIKDGATTEHAALIHSRFRPPDRKAHEKILHAAGGRVVIATQAVEAGVDISARLLVTELAPWPSLVQRFGRCNRYGECTEGVEIFWVDLKTRGEKDELALPYSADELRAARDLLGILGDNASPRSLKEKVEYKSPREIRPVIRRKDLVDLFDTTPDLCGNDLDISRYVRDGNDTDVQVHWRDVPAEAPMDDEPRPQREEVCRVSIVEFGKFLKRKPRVFWWNPLEEKWERVKRARPGQVYLIDRESGGYCDKLGWTGKAKDNKMSITAPSKGEDEKREAMGRNRDSFVGRFVLLDEHTTDVVDEAENLVAALSLDDATADALRTAARWHDVGKTHEEFQKMLHAGAPDEFAAKLLAKSAKQEGRCKRRNFRHELASALAWLQNAPSDPPGRDLVAFLIAAHHGKVRLSIRSLPNETPPPEPDKLYARGVWDGDPLPGVPFENFSVNSQTILRFNLDLSVMKLGDGPCGTSWLAGMVALRDARGPFRLAWLETLLRVADMRASAAEAHPKK